MPESKKIVIVSSTARDLPEHRKEVMDACLRQSMFPQMMEHLPAIDADAIAASLKLVDEADIYLGVFAYRYGYVPKGHDISITEMEYNRAAERGIPRLIFLMHEDHPVKASDVETGEGAQKLKTLKERLERERVGDFFKSPAELRANVIDSLSQYNEHDETALHYVSEIPAPPEIYVAHPYTLLQPYGLVGRLQELDLLTDWVTKQGSDVYQAHIFNIVAIGGMGKSALTWKWFNDIAPDKMNPLAGRMWWSFYESDATFENFIIRALAYVTGRAREDIGENTKPGQREDMLLAVLDRNPFLLVLDGLERILIAYARMDASRLADDDLDQRTANAVAGAMGLPESAAQSFTGRHRLRKTADPRAGNFLRKLSGVRKSKILVSTRLYPADLQTFMGEPIPGSFAHFLQELDEDSALELWRSFKVSGSRNALLNIFRAIDYHPLLIQALASVVANYRRAPGDFDLWLKSNPSFDPFNLPREHVKSNVLEHSLNSLSEEARQVLYIVAAFRMPATYDTLASLLVGEDKRFANENRLDEILTELEDRGLMGWDKRANRYDLHPIVRGVTWSTLRKDDRQNIYGMLEAHFEVIPKISDDEINSLDDLAPSIELYDKLIGLERYDNAWEIFLDRIVDGLFKIHAMRQMTELLIMLCSEDKEYAPHVEKYVKFGTLFYLAMAYQFSGYPKNAIALARQALSLSEKIKEEKTSIISDIKGVMGLALCLSGSLRESEANTRQALYSAKFSSDEFNGLFLGIGLYMRGIIDESKKILQNILLNTTSDHDKSWVTSSLSDLALKMGDLKTALSLADSAWALAKESKMMFIRAARLQGFANLYLGNMEKAEERLYYAVVNAQDTNHIEELLPAFIGLAELRRQQKELQAARDHLDDVWEAAERGPYPLFHADALNVLAQIERDAGNTDKAIQAATEAYRKAWCDGPPFAYHWGLEAARKHLAELGADIPTDLPPYDESKYEPMPDVKIDPPDLPVKSDQTEE